MAASGGAPSRDPAFYALLAVDAAHMGICCAKEATQVLAAIAELASAEGKSLAEISKQLARIKRKVASASRDADEHLELLASAHDEVDGMRLALKGSVMRDISNGRTPPVGVAAAPQELSADAPQSPRTHSCQIITTIGV